MKTKLLFIVFFTFCSFYIFSQNIYGQDIALNESEKTVIYNELIARGRQLAWLVFEETSAVEVFTEAIRLIPNRAEAYYERAIVYSLWSYPYKYEEALRDITTAIRYDPPNSDYFILRGNIYSSYSDRYQGSVLESNYQNREYNHYITCRRNAISDYTTALRLNPSDSNYVYFQRGSEYLFLKEWNNVISDMTRIISNMNRESRNFNYYSKEVYRYRGQAYYELSEFILADLDFNAYSNLTGNEYTADIYVTRKLNDEEYNKKYRLRRP
jgi:tetratricopeptide (TPR) repeat protein